MHKKDVGLEEAFILTMYIQNLSQLKKTQL